MPTPPVPMGTIQGDRYYFAGDPDDPASWEPVEQDGLRFKGGDPTSADAWEQIAAPATGEALAQELDKPEAVALNTAANPEERARLTAGVEQERMRALGTLGRDLWAGQDGKFFGMQIASAPALNTRASDDERLAMQQEVADHEAAAAVKAMGETSRGAEPFLKAANIPFSLALAPVKHAIEPSRQDPFSEASAFWDTVKGAVWEKQVAGADLVGASMARWIQGGADEPDKLERARIVKGFLKEHPIGHFMAGMALDIANPVGLVSVGAKAANTGRRTLVSLGGHTIIEGAPVLRAASTVGQAAERAAQRSGVGTALHRLLGTKWGVPVDIAKLVDITEDNAQALRYRLKQAFGDVAEEAAAGKTLLDEMAADVGIPRREMEIRIDDAVESELIAQRLKNGDITPQEAAVAEWTKEYGEDFLREEVRRDVPVGDHLGYVRHLYTEEGLKAIQKRRRVGSPTENANLAMTEFLDDMRDIQRGSRRIQHKEIGNLARRLTASAVAVNRSGQKQLAKNVQDNFYWMQNGIDLLLKQPDPTLQRQAIRLVEQIEKGVKGNIRADKKATREFSTIAGQLLRTVGSEADSAALRQTVTEHMRTLRADVLSLGNKREVSKAITGATHELVGTLRQHGQSIRTELQTFAEMLGTDLKLQAGDSAQALIGDTDSVFSAAHDILATKLQTSLGRRRQKDIQTVVASLGRDIEKVLKSRGSLLEDDIKALTAQLKKDLNGIVSAGGRQSDAEIGRRFAELQRAVRQSIYEVAGRQDEGSALALLNREMRQGFTKHRVGDMTLKAKQLWAEAKGIVPPGTPFVITDPLHIHAVRLKEHIKATTAAEALAEVGKMPGVMRNPAPPTNINKVTLRPRPEPWTAKELRSLSERGYVGHMDGPLQGLATPKAWDEWLIPMGRMADPESFDALTRTFRAFNAWFKPWSLFIRPSYTSRNVASNMAMVHLRLGEWNPMDWMRGFLGMLGVKKGVLTKLGDAGEKLGISSLRGADNAVRRKTLKKASLSQLARDMSRIEVRKGIKDYLSDPVVFEGQPLTYEKILDLADQHGIVESGFILGDVAQMDRLLDPAIQSGAKTPLQHFMDLIPLSPVRIKENNWLKLGIAGNGFVENTFRLGAFIQQLRKAGKQRPLVASDAVEFARVVDETLYNHLRGNSSRLQQRMRAWIPFWSWMKNNSVTMLRRAFTEPKRVARYQQARLNIEAAAQGMDDEAPIPGMWLPDEMQRALPFNLGRSPEDPEVAQTALGLGFLPLADLAIFNLSDPEGIAKTIVNGLNPLLKTAVEFAPVPFQDGATRGVKTFRSSMSHIEPIEQGGADVSFLGFNVDPFWGHLLSGVVALNELDRVNFFDLAGKPGQRGVGGAVRMRQDPSMTARLVQFFTGFKRYDVRASSTMWSRFRDRMTEHAELVRLLSRYRDAPEEQAKIRHNIYKNMKELEGLLAEYNRTVLPGQLRDRAAAVRDRQQMEREFRQLTMPGDAP